MYVYLFLTIVAAYVFWSMFPIICLKCQDLGSPPYLGMKKTKANVEINFKYENKVLDKSEVLIKTHVKFLLTFLLETNVKHGTK